LTDNTYLKILENAIFKHKRLKINYKTNCKILSTYGKCDPYGIVYWNGIWFLIGFCHKFKQFRTFFMNNIKEINQLNEYFEPNQDFDMVA
jgi:predicted DNA-binding transcriptional regulator YafY